MSLWYSVAEEKRPAFVCTNPKCAVDIYAETVHTKEVVNANR